MSKKISPWMVYAGIVIILLAAFLFMHSPYFVVYEIRITGASRLTEDEIRFLLGINEGVNLWSLNLDKLSGRLREHPAIERADLRRIMPGTLEVSLVERAPVALVPYYRYFLALDSHGVAISLLETLASTNLPVITGAAAPQVNLGQVYPEARVNLALKALIGLGPEWYRTISEAHVGSPEEITLYGNHDLLIRIGVTGDLSRKLENLRAVLADAKTKRLALKYIDLRFDGNPVVRLKE